MGKTKKYSMKEDFSMVAVLTIPICVAINVVGDQIVQLLKDRKSVV